MHVGASTAPEGDDHASAGEGGRGKHLMPKKEKGGASPAKKAKDKEGGGKSARPKDKAAEDKEGGGKSARLKDKAEDNDKGLKSPLKTPKKQKSARFDPDTMDDAAAEKLKSAVATKAVPSAMPIAKKPPKAPMPKGVNGKDARASESASGLTQLPQAAALPPQPVSFEPLADARADGTLVDPPTAAEHEHSTETPAPKHKQKTDRGTADLRARIMSRGF